MEDVTLHWSFPARDEVRFLRVSVLDEILLCVPSCAYQI